VAEAGERNRALTIIKSRGTDHSNQVRELQLSDRGIDLEDVYVAEGRVLMGSARAQKEAEARQAEVANRLLHEQSKQQLDHDIAELKARIELLSDDLNAKRLQADLHQSSEDIRLETQGEAALQRRALRSGDLATPNGQRTDKRRLS
jgi:circadian clock protein KaiC